MKQIIGKKTILEQCPEILTDESRYTSGVPNEVLFPENIPELQGIMRRATKENIHVTFSGGRTGITGGAVPENDDIVVSFSAMKNIVKCEQNSSGTPILYCEPGITLESIASFLDNPGKWHKTIPGQELLCNKNFIYFPDPTELTAQLGGTVATNASGARSFHFGPTRNHIDYLEIVLASGELISLKRGSNVQESWNMLSQKVNGKLEQPTYSYAKVKNASGFYNSPELDPIDLFIGSEGTLGAICTIGIRLAPKPTFLSGLTFFKSRTQAFDFADFLRENPNAASIEYFDESVFDIFTNSEVRPSKELPSIPANTRCAVY
ncbi:MAG: FAD-binding oxidoreductase, partial [Fibrobacter sp.]|nr:FAD-binding oxidoreductase [Fibrobacter sp.]